jgi:N-acetylglucosamine-6-sulfatase
LGNHRAVGGKALPFAEDTNLPFVVRGPGVPKGATSKLPAAHLDLAPTFLDIAGLAEDQWPVFLDGRSLLDQWHNPNQQGANYGNGSAKEILNVEFWGPCHFEAPPFQTFPKNSYKTLRIVGENESWLFSKWCTNEMELYNTNVRFPSTRFDGDISLISF